MPIKEKVFDLMVRNNMFRKNYVAVINQLSKSLKVTKKVIVSALQELQKEKSIAFKTKEFTNCRQLVNGIFTSSVKDDFGFVRIDGINENFYVKSSDNVTNGDTVAVYINNDKKFPCATIQKIVKKNKQNVYGRIIKTSNEKYLFIPDDKEVYGKFINIPQDELAKNSVNKKCCLTLENFDENTVINNDSYGTINQVYGLAGDPIVENVVIAKHHGFVKEFKQPVLQETKFIPNKVLENELKNRLDLRDKKFVTIDPATCKDMDDAVYIEKQPFGYRIYTAIADVEHYVKLNSEIDNEAFKRGTSCYLGDGVYPMLPECLSNEICSLEENKDRLAKITIVDMDKNGKILDYSINSGVINSKHKLSYNIADDIHFNNNNAQITYSDVKNEIDLMFEASDILVNLRKKRGCLFIESKEPTFKLDDTKTKILEVTDEHSLLKSTKIIESFMILTNEIVGHYFTVNNLDTLFRTHSQPTKSSLKELNEILQNFNFPPVEGTSISYQKLLKQIKGNEYEEYLTKMILRSMQKAIYQPDNIGHFGLASSEYIHFTSPIRRYPDLVTHRILTSHQSQKGYFPSYEQLFAIGQHLSEREKQAQEAENESNKLMIAMWAENNINKIFDGKISEILETGIVVNNGVIEVFIPISDLSQNKYGSYKINETKTALVNDKINHQYKIADTLKFKIIEANRINKKVYATTDLEKVAQKNTNVTEQMCEDELSM